MHCCNFNCQPQWCNKDRAPKILSNYFLLGSGLKNLPTSGKLNHTAAENQNQSQPENSNKTTAFSSNQLSFQLPIAISGLLKSREMDVLPLPL